MQIVNQTAFVVS